MSTAPDRLGVVFGSLTPPEALAAGAAQAEQLGFGELWFSEDCFFTGGVSGLTQLLASTHEIPAGLGLASVMTRHPAVLAMELAGLARMHPGRSRAGIGLGNRHWLQQLGLLPDRPLSAVADTFAALRTLLRGDTVTGATSAHHFDDVTLAFPPAHPPELWMGTVNERALRLAGANADGVLLSVLAGPTYVRWAREQIARGAADSGRAVPRITAFALAAVDDHPATARDAVREAVAFFAQAEAHTALVGRSRYGRSVREWPGSLRAEDVSDAWLDEFAVAGSPVQVASGLRDLLAAGADAVGLWLFPSDRFDETLRRVAHEVAPLL